MPKKTRNPQDATGRNIKASNARDKYQREWLARLEKRIEYLESEVRALRQKQDLSEDFASAQRRLGYRHSTSAPNSIIVKRD